MANGNFAGGTGRNGDPYLIEDAHDLNAVRNNASGYYKLVSDIDLNIAPYNEGEGWEPLTIYREFDGNFHKIKNLYINRPNITYVGLFRRIRTTSSYVNAEVKNLKLTNVNIIAYNSSKVGALAGSSGGEANIENCYAEGIINGGIYIGGIIGEVTSEMTINNCSTSCNIFSDINSENIGGICGYGHGVAIYNSRSDSNIKIGDENNSSINIGGIIGRISTNSSNRVYIKYNYSLGNLPKENFPNGGIVPSASASFTYFSNNFWDKEFVGVDNANDAGLPLTTKEMKNPETFSNYNKDIWVIEAGEYPRLWFEEPPIKNTFFFRDALNLKTFDLGSKTWVEVDNRKKNKAQGISSLDNLIQNTTKNIKPKKVQESDQGSIFNEPVNLKAFKTINSFSIL